MEDNNEIMTLEENEINDEIVETEETGYAGEISIATISGLMLAGAAIGILAHKATKPIRNKAKSKISKLFRKKKNDDPVIVDCEVWDETTEEDIQNNK